MHMPYDCIISCNGTENFASSLSNLLDLPLIHNELSQFPNEELRLRIPKCGQYPLLLGSLSRPVNTHIIEYLLAADALKRLGASHITGVIPWLAYSKQDKVFREGEPLSVKVITSILQAASIKELFTLDLHNPSIAGYFDIPVHNLSAFSLFTTHAKTNLVDNSIIVSPDAGSVKNSAKVAETLGLDIAYASKSRDLNTGEVQFNDISKEITQKNVYIFDDMISTGSTLLQIADFLKLKGANDIYVYATHHLHLTGIQEKIDLSPIKQIVTTNSITPIDTNSSKKLEILDIAPIIVEFINY